MGWEGEGAPPDRLGIYQDTSYYSHGEPASVWADPFDAAFLTFACEVGRRFRSTVLFGRATRATPPPDFAEVRDVSLVELPPYEDLRHLRGVARATGGTLRGFWRGLTRVDVIWVFGPHPFGLVLVALGLLRGKRVVLGVRQDTLAYYRGRLPSRRWAPALAAVWLLDACYRWLARRLRATVVGPAIRHRYGDDRQTVLEMTVSLIRSQDVATEPVPHSWSGPIALLSVGRLEPEKNPVLLVEALAELDRLRPGRYRLAVVGCGRLEQAIRERAESLGLSSRVEMPGHVPFGPGLLERYRGAHAFVHVSLTEGVPQVLIEAMASGIPVVATDVGGVAAAIDHGRAGLLVPPSDAAAVAGAIIRLTDDEALRQRIVERGLALARGVTLEQEAARVAAFVGATNGAGRW